jgi:uncharacterized protein (DUF697 family)
MSQDSDNGQVPKVKRKRRRLYDGGAKEATATKAETKPKNDEAATKADTKSQKDEAASSSAHESSETAAIRPEHESSAARLAQAHRLIQNHEIAAGGLGLIPIPLLDLATVTAVQFRMVRRLAHLYGVDFPPQRVRVLLPTLLGTGVSIAGGKGLLALVTRNLPGFGAVIKPLTVPAASVAATRAVGFVFLQHFETGGTLLDLDPAHLRARFRNRGKVG